MALPLTRADARCRARLFHVPADPPGDSCARKACVGLCSPRRLHKLLKLVGAEEDLTGSAPRISGLDHPGTSVLSRFDLQLSLWQLCLDCGGQGVRFVPRHALMLRLLGHVLYLLQAPEKHEQVLQYLDRL